MDKKLYRDEYHKKIAGVCAGLAEYFNVDVAVVRVLFVLASIFHGGGLLIYIVLWIALPKKPLAFYDPHVDYRVPPQTPPGGNPFGGNPFQGNPTGGNPFGGNPFQNPPPMPPQSPRNTTSLVAIIFGVVLIIIGGSILLDDFDILPDWDFEQLWPIILIVVGCAIMISGQQKKPWEKEDWHKKDPIENKPADEDAHEANPPADNPPTV